MEKVVLKIQKCNENAVIPSFAKSGDAGMDLYVNEDKILKAHSFTDVGTGLKVEIPDGYEIQIRPRSGLALKNGVSVLNTPGTIDSGYRGEIRIILFNVSDTDFEIKSGMRMAQMVFAKLQQFEIVEVNSVDENTERSTTGFGSSGLKK